MITDYNSFVEIFTGLNIAYAGSNDFRNLLDHKILKISSSFKALKDDQGKVEGRALLFPNQLLKNRTRKLRMLQVIKSKKLCESANRHTECSGLFKSAFLFAGFYCLIFLFCSASIANKVHLKESKAILLFLSIIVIVYNLIVFVLAFTKSRSKKIKPYKPITIFISGLVISILIAEFKASKDIDSFAISICKNFMRFEIYDLKYLIYIPLLISISPIILHLFHSLVMVVYTWIRNLWSFWQWKALMLEIQKDAADFHRVPFEASLIKKIFFGILLFWMNHRLDKRAT